jgi:hypothetical protein
VLTKYDAELIKIASPLYRLQNHFYETIGKKISGQDGELLQFLAQKIEKESPGWLANVFLAQIQETNKELIINDDCRLNSYYALKNNGFRFIRVDTSVENIIRRQREDHTKINPNHPVEQGFEHFQTDYVIDNNGLLEDTLCQTAVILEKLLYGDGR